VFGVDRISGSVLDRLDEIRPCDLCSSPVDTLENAANRAFEEMWSGPDELLPEQPWEEELPEGVEHIRSFRRLFIEGQEMRHCVASYADQIVQKRCNIFSIQTKDGGRSTVSVVNGRVSQHKAQCNKQPPESCCKVAEKVAALVQ
jgi:hypothetical protein